ncbi:hypothetical protein NRB16_24585 [Pseudomonas sp. LJDD11]|uniref:hypothetical protein n=1 Tax=Pseudomonas sp. LJDD11 TaxID=2931984 RepID=UPI00211C7B2D|nr:hypothetical protein [Pseudomonas sp. LJDD11]MCQ9426702.1 hypothetical protein [Pseudomonas sp. LJDD11]
MLSCDEIAQLSAAICATAEALGQTISANAARLMAGDLAEYQPAAIQGALRACRRELTGRLTLAAILQRIHGCDGRPGKDEAWAIALTACDEGETVVLTDEIRQALVAARPVMAVGDRIGARMAFISAYERLVTLARAAAQPARWGVSLGFDAGRRVQAVEAAVRAQLISQEAGTRYLADLQLVPITQDGQAIAGLLTGSVVEPSPHIREKWAEVRASVEAAKARRERGRLKKAQAERVYFYLRKRKVRQALAARCKEQNHG